jgi:hypothetical protein
MHANIGRTDRMIRLLVGIGLLVFYFVNQGDVRWAGLLALIALVTSIVGVCPLYSLLGTNTCEKPAGS